MAHEAQEQPQFQQYPGPIVYYSAPPMNHRTAVVKDFVPHYAAFRKASINLGAIQIFLGCASIAAGIMAIVSLAGLMFVGIGIWAGVFYVIAGSIAVQTGKTPTNKLITATLVCSVFDILLGICQTITSSIGLIEETYCDPYYTVCDDQWRTAVAANSMNVLIGSLEIILGIAMTVISGHAVDKGSKAQPANFPVAYAPSTHPETVFIQSQSAFQSQPPTHPGTVFIQSQPAFQPQPPTHPGTVFIQSQPALQPQPPPYYVQSQYPSTSNPPQMMYVGVHQAPLTTIKL